MNTKLPYPFLTQDKEIFQLLNSRYSCRDFSKRGLTLEQIANLLWSASGKIGDSATQATTRTIPSAGATYPLEIYLAIGEDAVSGMEAGLYRYSIENHSLTTVFNDRDIRKELSVACLGQDFISQAPVCLIINAQFNRTTSRYGQRGISYVYMEVGHSCQNVYLMATSLGLATVEIGAFHNDQVKKLLSLDTEPIAIMPVGYRR